MFLLALAFACSSLPQDPPGGIVPVHLRCERHVDPLAVDILKPALTWQLAAVVAGARGLWQTAWQVQVASDATLLAGDRADLWDSGKVVSRSTIDCEYGGAPLGSRQRCVWRVRAWDQAGHVGPWSELASFRMGLLAPADWQAQWIGQDAPLLERPPACDLEGGVWIWQQGEDGKPMQGELCCRGRWTLPAEWQQALLLITADDQFELWINGVHAGASDGKADAWQRPLRLDATKLLQPGENVVAVRARNLGGDGGLIAKLALEVGGEWIRCVTDKSWRVSASAAEGWQQAGFDDAAWQPAHAIGGHGVRPWRVVAPRTKFLPPPRVLGKPFALAQAPVRGTIYASAFGLYEVELNGRKVGDEFFAPGWTDYDKRVYYQAHDVTTALRQGDNALTVLLAAGWYAGYVGYGHKREHYGDKTRARVQLELEFADGSRQVIASDGSWQATTGELREADFLMGEVCDRTFVPPPAVSVVVGESPARMQVHPGEPVRVVAELTPVSITRTGDDTWVCDLGQNIAGFARLCVRGERGQRITLRFAERLDPDGTIYTENLRMARCTDSYVCAGEGEEIWQPRFSFHGFQYVEVTGLGRAPTAKTITGVALSSDTPMTGEFSCSEPMVNRLVSNIRWTQRMNFIDIPTDCPQRDERLGWTGDAQAYIRTATCLADVQSFFTKWLVDLADAQRLDGQFPMVAPVKVAGSDGGPAWADAGTICPWNIYEVYGDRRLLWRQYGSMERFIAFCRARSTKDLLPPAEFHCFGDWLHVDDDTPKQVIYMAYFAQSTRIVAQAARVLGDEPGAERYEALWQRVRAAFQREYVDAEGHVLGRSQTAYVLALAFDLLDDAQREQAATHLVAHIEGRNGHLSTGFVRTKDLMLVLDKLGRNDIAYRLLMNRTFPSWGFTIENGATSIWERWNGWTPEHGFNDPGMNSFAHYAFGAVGQWLFEVPGGIKTMGPAYDRILIAPQPGGKLAWVKARLGTVHGEVATSWRVDGGQFVLDVEVPVNAVAEVRLPGGDLAGVRVDGKVIGEVAGVRVVDGGLEIGSGRWTFTAQR